VENTWFTVVYVAEMAMATLHDTVLSDVTPHHVLRLSSSLKLEKPSSTGKTLSVFVKSSIQHPINDLSAQDLFTMFRPAGDINLVRTNFNIGYNNPAPVLEYSRADCVAAARIILRDAVSAKRWPECQLQAYDPQILYVHVCTCFFFF
jgi:hypothetical protein